MTSRLSAAATLLTATVAIWPAALPAQPPAAGSTANVPAAVSAANAPAAGGAAAGPASETKYDLRYRLRKGQEFSLRNMYVGHTFQKRGDVTSKTGSLTRDLQLVYRVLDANDAGMTVEVEYRKKLYRGSDKDGNVAVTDFAPIVGRKVRHAISPAGELGGFDGFDEMPSVPMPGGWNYDGPRYREELEHMFPTLPGKPIARGESWTRSAFGSRIEYTLIDEVPMFGRSCLRIFARVESEQTRSQRKDQAGNPVTFEQVEPYSDIYYFDHERGMMLSRFSVASLGQTTVTDAKGAVLMQQLTDRLYETYVTFR